MKTACPRGDGCASMPQRKKHMSLLVLLRLNVHGSEGAGIPNCGNGKRNNRRDEKWLNGVACKKKLPTEDAWNKRKQPNAAYKKIAVKRLKDRHTGRTQHECFTVIMSHQQGRTSTLEKKPENEARRTVRLQMHASAAKLLRRIGSLHVACLTNCVLRTIRL